MSNYVIKEDINEGKLELLTIISRTLQILSSFILIVIVISFVTIKVKSRKNKNGTTNFSNKGEGKKMMSESIIANTKSRNEIPPDERNSTKQNSELKNLEYKKRVKIYAVYNPNNFPNFYLHNKLNWYKNFD